MLMKVFGLQFLARKTKAMSGTVSDEISREVRVSEIKIGKQSINSDRAALISNYFRKVIDDSVRPSTFPESYQLRKEDNSICLFPYSDVTEEIHDSVVEDIMVILSQSYSDEELFEKANEYYDSGVELPEFFYELEQLLNDVKVEGDDVNP